MRRATLLGPVIVIVLVQAIALLTVRVNAQEDLAALWQQTTDAFNAGAFTVEEYGAPGSIGEGVPCSALGTTTCDFGEGFASLVASGIFDGGEFTNLSVTQNGNVVSGQRELRSDLITRLGFERVVQNYEVEYRDGLIVRLSVFPDTTDSETAAFLDARAAAAAMQAVDGLPSAGSGGLAGGDSGGAPRAMALATVAAGAVLLSGLGIRLQRRRR